MTGRILKGIGGFYTVECEDGGIFICKARGKLRKTGLVPAVGDIVKVSQKASEHVIDEIMPRKNELIRPAVANMDQLIIVAAVSAPKPDLLLIDKLMVQAERKGIAPVLVLNKCDDEKDNLTDEILKDYSATGYQIFKVSALNGEGIADFRQALKGKTSCFAGQSAVGKSSLLNSILPGLKLPVGELAEHIERGRHTTRHVELISLPEGGAVLDTPGFSLLDLGEIEPAELSGYYPEMRDARNDCRFVGCLHMTEPGCMVKPLLECNKLSQGRYERYKSLVGFLIEERRHRYD